MMFGRRARRLQRLRLESLAKSHSDDNHNTSPNSDCEGSQGTPSSPVNLPNPAGGDVAFKDYHMQLMLLEQQNKERLLLERQGQDNMSHPPPPYSAAMGALQQKASTLEGSTRTSEDSDDIAFARIFRETEEAEMQEKAVGMTAIDMKDVELEDIDVEKGQVSELRGSVSLLLGIPAMESFH